MLGESFLPGSGGGTSKVYYYQGGPAHDFGSFVMRCAVAAMLFHHGLQKYNSPSGVEKTIDSYFPFFLDYSKQLNLPAGYEITSLTFAYLTAFIEMGGSVFLILGISLRLTSLLIGIVMTFALQYHLLKTGDEGAPYGVGNNEHYSQYAYEPCVLILGICINLFLTGGGNIKLCS